MTRAVARPYRCERSPARRSCLPALGEKLDALEVFHPDRLASRILGMGDMLSLIEKAQQNYDQGKAKELERKLKKNEFTIEDFGDQLKTIKKMGSIGDLLGMIPGLKKIAGAGGFRRSQARVGADSGDNRLDDLSGAPQSSDS